MGHSVVHFAGDDGTDDYDFLSDDQRSNDGRTDECSNYELDDHCISDFIDVEHYHHF